MSAPIEQPIKVEIKNWADAPAPPPEVKSVTLKTYILDPASPGVNLMYQITNYEPKRLRLIIQVLDAPVLLVSEAPSPSPAPASVAAGPPPQGRLLPVSTGEYIIYGPDALWLNSITGSTAGRVTVTKEYR